MMPAPRSLCAVQRNLQSLLLLGATLLGTVPAAAQEAPFVATNSMPVGRAMHGSVVLGDYLYVIGGKVDESVPAPLRNEGNFTRSVMKAPILPSGHLGQWSSDRSIPQTRAYIGNSSVALNDMVYIVGGTEGLEDLGKPSVKFKTVLISKPGPEGVLQPWVESSPFPGLGRSLVTVCATPGFIHIIGGNTDQLEPTNEVITGVLAADGTIGTWEPGPPLPSPIWFHHSAVASGRVWVWGGLAGESSSTISNKVYSSVINGSGRLDPWVQESTVLPEAIFRGANAVAGPFLMTFCVSYGSAKETSDVMFSYLSPQGLTPWLKIPSGLPMNIYASCAPDYRRGTIFLPGGQTTRTPSPDDVVVLKDVIYFRLTQQARNTIQTLNTREEIAQSSEITGTSAGQSSQYSFDANAQQTGGMVPAFLPYEVARRALLSRSGKPLIAYFHMEGSGPSEAQKQRLLQDTGLGPLSERAIFAWVDVKQSPQIAQQFGIFRAPTWILYDPNGRELGRAAKSLGSAELSAGIQSVRP